MTKILLGILVAVSTVPILMGHSQAKDFGFGVRFIAQDKITFETDHQTTYIEAASTFDGDDVSTDTPADQK